MKRYLLTALMSACGLLGATAAGAEIIYEDEPVATERVVTHRVYTEGYAGPVRTWRTVRVYHEPRVIYDREPERILPPGPHRIVQDVLFGD